MTRRNKTEVALITHVRLFLYMPPCNMNSQVTCCNSGKLAHIASTRLVRPSVHPKIGKFACFIFTFIANGMSNHFYYCWKNRTLCNRKGLVRVPQPMNFPKNSKGGGGIFNPKIYIADFGPVYRAFFGRFPKKLQHKFPKMWGRGDQRPFGTFPKIQQLFLKLVAICNSKERYRWHNVLKRMTSVTHVSLSTSAPHVWFCWHIDHCPSTMSVHLLPKNVTFSCPWEQRLSMKSGQRAWKDLLSYGLKE